MRLSDAILLGSVLIKPYPGKVFRRDGTGCAIGMAMIANGAMPDEFIKTETCWDAFPVLKQPVSTLPCGHKWEEINRDIHDVFTAIGHIFDYHFHSWSPDDNTWTLEQLADWVRSIEPAEPEEESDGPDPYDAQVEQEMEKERERVRTDNEREW